MLQRYIFPKIQSHLEKNPILLLLGSRGVKKYEIISSAIENQEELLKAIDQTIKYFNDGDLVSGTVVKIDRDEVLLDIGYCNLRTCGSSCGHVLLLLYDLDLPGHIKISC